MMTITLETPNIQPHIAPPLDTAFCPLVLANHAFSHAVAESGHATPLVFTLERQDGKCSRFETAVFSLGTQGCEGNIVYAERVLKSLLWMRGGWRVYVGGPSEVGSILQQMYSPNGQRAFDAAFMGRVYEEEFTVQPCSPNDVFGGQEVFPKRDGHLEGCRIGFDAGASYRKVAALIDGNVVFSAAMAWDPQSQHDPQYHYGKIMEALCAAAEHLPRVDAIGISAAGAYINKRTRISSLFRSVPDALFKEKITNLFPNIQHAWGDVPLEVANDGDITALAGAMAMGNTGMLGISMGSSEAGGYVTTDGTLTDWLNELAFVPLDLQRDAYIDEWSGDTGCGVQYLSQQAVGRLARAAGLPVDPSLSNSACLMAVQQLASAGDERVRPIYETIGTYLGYAVAYYADFYDFHHALILGGVTAGEGGTIMMDSARSVIKHEFPSLSEVITLQIPDESHRYVGQAIAAASLPVLRT
ncbi:MAG TPA: ROK family protein [Armatimonadota bacterium]|nr:ROK family protein [Armatimonadota bacterium]